MKKKKRKIFLFLIIIFIIVMFFIQNKKDFKNQFQDQFIFFKLFSSKSEEDKNTLMSSEKQKDSKDQLYTFEVSYYNINFKEIFLLDTMQKDQSSHRKIAPGTGGEFQILLKSNQKINYQIKFESQNQKPKNLSFQIEGKDRKYTKLEDMEEELTGELIDHKKIKIFWRWEYEKDQMQNLEDTKDGENLKQYNFMIYAIGI